MGKSDADEIADLLKSGGKEVIALAVPEVPFKVRRYFLQFATQTGAFRVASFVPAEIGPARQTGVFEMLDLVSLNEAEAGELVDSSFFSRTVMRSSSSARTFCSGLARVCEWC